MPPSTGTSSPGAPEAAAAFFRCLVCGAREVAVGPDAWRCVPAGHAYAVADGIPLLVRDPAGHAARLAALHRERPGWHAREQPGEGASPWRHHVRKRRRHVEEILARRDAAAGGPAATLLDLGCGDGLHLPQLAPHARALWASDFNAGRLRRARARHPGAAFFLADILDYPAADDFFEVVFCHHVLEHLADDEGALRTIRRILRPGGICVLGAPNEGAPWWRLAYRLQPATRAATDHVHFYTADALRAKAERAGLAVRETTHLGWGPPHWWLDGQLRRFRALDDLFERVGRALVPRQASSLYLVLAKEA